jgi:histidinol phosphatase-like enzyme
MKRKAAFLNRDGVINVDHGYVHRPEDFEFVEGIFGTCRKLQGRKTDMQAVESVGIGRRLQVPTSDLTTPVSAGTTAQLPRR